MTQRQVTLKKVCGYLMLESFIGHVCQTHMYVALSDLIHAVSIYDIV